jgi:hypothetical protein
VDTVDFHLILIYFCIYHDVHAHVRFLQVPGAKGRVLRFNPRPGQRWKIGMQLDNKKSHSTHFFQFLQTYLEAAKTKFNKGYKGLNPSKITTTVGLNIGQIDTKGIRLSFWDLGGQEELQSLWDKV